MANLQKSLALVVFLLAACQNGLVAEFKFGSQNSTIKLKTANSQLNINAPVNSFKGTLKIESENASSVQSTNQSFIVFDQGVLSSGASSYILTGTYDGTSTDKTILGAGDTLEVAFGQVFQTVQAKGSVANPSIIRGQPVFSYSPEIFDASSSLALALENQLTKPIVLGGGTLKLLGHLSLSEDAFFSGSGTINCNQFKLSLPTNYSAPWANNLTLQNVSEIFLNGMTNLSGTWDFSDPSGTSFLNGNGNILDLSSGGVLKVASNHTLHLVDLHIKGLGNTLGKLNLNEINGTVKLTNTTLELGGNYGHDSGNIYIQGDKCKLIAGNTVLGNFSFDVSGTGTLTVDHQTFEYEPLGSPDIYPFTFTDVVNQKILVNGGQIRSATQGIGNVNLVVDVAATLPELNSNYFLSSNCNIITTNSLGGPQPLTINGNGYTINFPVMGAGFFQVGNNVILTLTNTTILPYNQSSFSFAPGGTLKFGEGCTVVLSKDLLLDSGASALTFVGNATLDASGQTIRITAGSKVTITNGNNLTIKNARIEVANTTALSCLTNASKITFSNCTIHIESAGFSWSTGNIDVSGCTKIYGSNELVPGALTNFTFSSGGKLTVLKNSKLELFDKLNFIYQANPTTNSDTLAQSKRHFLLQTPSATLALSGCTLTSTDTGLAIDYGNLFVDNKTSLVSSVSSKVEFGSALQVYLAPGAVFEVDGPIEYTQTSYP